MIRRAFCFCLFLIAASVFASAQCPTLSVSGPTKVKVGEPIIFSVDVKGGDPNAQRTYNWTVSAGIIMAGQGTSVITVDTTDAGGRSATATVAIGGLERRCKNTKSMTTGIIPKAQPPKAKTAPKKPGTGNRA